MLFLFISQYLLSVTTATSVLWLCETPQGPAQEWSILTSSEKFCHKKFSEFCWRVWWEGLTGGNESVPGGGQIIIIVIVQFNWQKDPVKSSRKWHKIWQILQNIHSFIIWCWNSLKMKHIKYVEIYVSFCKCQFPLISSSKSQILYPRTLIKLSSNQT